MLNFKHLHYFWVVGRQGGIVKASEYLHVTPQTISGQVSLLEEQVGQKLFEKAGRGLQLTDTGKLVMSYADDIFSLGDELEERLIHADEEQPIVLKVGVADAVPKTIASRVLRPALQMNERIRFVCRESSQENLLAELALHRLDMVVADGPIPNNLGIKGFNHYLGASSISFLAAASLNLDPESFPKCLNNAPLLLPSDVSQISAPLMQWFTEQNLSPRIVGEFDDSALMKAFGQDGVGVFVVPTAISEEVAEQYDAIELGRTDDVRDLFYVITSDRRSSNPAIQTIIEAAREWLVTE